MPLSIGGSDDEANLWLLCPSCNLAKGKHSEGQDELTDKIVPFVNPRTQSWNEHFEWSSDALSIMGKSAVGRVTVRIAKLNSDLHRRVRAIGYGQVCTHHRINNYQKPILAYSKSLISLNGSSLSVKSGR
ncbi:MAG: HNH endonuclease [Acidobacteria bacterium]|nr:HNH endonuclease [Acidobacteriota bacterium]